MRVFLTAALLALVAAPAADARTDRLDRSFGGGRGSIRVFVGGGSSQAFHAVRTRTGKLLLAGSGWSGGAGRYGVAMARLHPSGRVDRSFARRGRTIFGSGRLDDPRAIAQLPDGRVQLLVTRPSSDFGVTRLGVVRVSAKGRWDRSFGVGGVAGIEFPRAIGDDGRFASMTVSHGRPVIAATTVVGDDERVLMARFTREGHLDPAFGSGGIAMPDVGFDPAAARRLARLPGGRVLLSARRGASPGASFARSPATVLVRIAEDGTVEPGWRVEAQRVEPFDLAVEPGGGIAALVYRRSFKNHSRWGVLRWRADGSLRDGFERWRRRPPFSTGDVFPSAGFARDRRGRFYVPGDLGAMARVRRDGSRDRRWATGGVTRQFRTRLELAARDVVVMSRRRVVTVGYGADEGDSREDFGRSGMWVAAFR